MTTIDVSAQFGGRDAARVLLPHFRSLKSALKETSFDGFPLPKVAFVLRVDGDVSSYGLSGAGNVHFDKQGEYVSVDIGLVRSDYTGRSTADIAALVTTAIVSGSVLLRGTNDPRLHEVRWELLEAALIAFCADYKRILASGA